MTNCPKCNATTIQLLKTWKNRQTTMALYECPSCKTKWRSKQVSPSTQPIEIPMINVIEAKESVMTSNINVPVMEAVSSNEAITPISTTSLSLRMQRSLPLILVLLIMCTLIACSIIYYKVYAYLPPK